MRSILNQECDTREWEMSFEHYLATNKSTGEVRRVLTYDPRGPMKYHLPSLSIARVESLAWRLQLRYNRWCDQAFLEMKELLSTQPQQRVEYDYRVFSLENGGISLSYCKNPDVTNEAGSRLLWLEKQNAKKKHLHGVFYAILLKLICDQLRPFGQPDQNKIKKAGQQFHLVINQRNYWFIVVVRLLHNNLKLEYLSEPDHQDVILRF